MDQPKKPDEPKANIEPVKLNLKSKFKFKCHKDIKCFTKCCRGINITLTPYDIIKMKNRLELSSQEFLAIYTDLRFLEKTDLPIVTLKLLDDELNSCPFVRDDGCLIYSDRPTTCRYYPLGVASMSHKEGADDNDFYFFVHEPHCLGFEEEKEWTIEEWRKDQGVDMHDDINAGWLICMTISMPAGPIWLSENDLFHQISNSRRKAKKCFSQPATTSTASNVLFLRVRFCPSMI